jgi:hypothetical protein
MFPVQKTWDLSNQKKETCITKLKLEILSLKVKKLCFIRNFEKGRGMFKQPEEWVPLELRSEAL